MTDRLNELLNAEDPRSFLKKALLLRSGKSGKVNLSEFSRHAGFSSRSFLSEYLAGRKGLSADSLQRIKSGLSLPRHYGLYFQLLVLREQPELSRQRNLNPEVELKALKQRMANGPALHPKLNHAKPVISKRQALRVYASLGSTESGASVFEIVNKTGLDMKTVQDSLELLVKQGLVEFKQNRFFAEESKLDFFDFSESELATLTKDITGEIGRQASDLTQSAEDLVFYSVLSVNKADLPELKEKLRSAVISVMDEFQRDEGNATEQIFVCLKK
jgi:hypothetical protein